MSTCRKSVLLLLTILTVELAAADLELPDGKGKEAVESTCTDCHDVQRIRAQHFDEERWNAIIREMIEKGASVNPDDLRVIVSYLVKNFGPDSDKKVNINKSSADRISTVLELTIGEAQSIVQYRAKNGNFKNLKELKKVAGLTDKIEEKKDLIDF